MMMVVVVAVSDNAIPFLSDDVAAAAGRYRHHGLILLWSLHFSQVPTSQPASIHLIFCWSELCWSADAAMSFNIADFLQQTHSPPLSLPFFTSLGSSEAFELFSFLVFFFIFFLG